MLRNKSSRHNMVADIIYDARRDKSRLVPTPGHRIKAASYAAT
jgi:hypothetical protein